MINLLINYPVRLEHQSVKEKAAITEETLRQLLSQSGSPIANRDLPEFKKFIGGYLEKVIVYEKHVEIIFKLLVVDLTYGEEGSIGIFHLPAPAPYSTGTLQQLLADNSRF
ncbi:hypothetical protein [Paenibacillus rigui]|uniref:Uncharacterized protein n=1 Tax=Paenibacillus rigui TaxID=554312 RepID=A0A229UGR5_9BACL|nr:hypothetical protein [Paenibacillus rigui]OXM82578.1 hypothetical protein CF651_30315 [Paenibacillus rigui]